MFFTETLCRYPRNVRLQTTDPGSHPVFSGTRSFPGVNLRGHRVNYEHHPDPRSKKE